MRRRPRPSRPAPAPAADPAWSRWRRAALDGGAPPPAERPGHGVWLVVTDLAHPTAWATVVVPAVGDPSVSASTGGLVSGASPAAARVLDAAAATLHLVPPAAGFELPPVGAVAFHVMTAEGAHSATVAEALLRSLDHPLALLFSAVQAVLADLRPR